MKKQRKERPSGFLCKVFYLASKIYLFFKGYKIKYNNEELKKYEGGYILINNHHCNDDHFMISAGVKGRRINYVVSSHYFNQKKTAFFLKLMRAISKEQFKNDINAIRRVKRVIDENGIIYIAPSGQVTLVSGAPYIPDSIVKLVRLCKCPVVAMKEHGAHLCFPKWGLFKRKYPITIDFETVVTKEDLDLLSDKDLYSKIYNSIAIDEYKEQEQKKIEIKSKAIIEGLEGALFMCPKCGKVFTHETHLNTMRCRSCGNTVYMDRYGFINPASDKDVFFKYPYDWYDYQKEEIKKLLRKDVLEYSYDVILRLYDKNKKDLVNAGFGKLVISKTEFYYEGTEYGKEIRKDFDLAHLIQTPFSPHTHIEVPDNEKFYQFKPINNKVKPVIWATVVDALFEMKEEK